MKTVTTSLVLSLLLGGFTQISADENIDARLSSIKNAAPSERQIMIKELQTEMKQMREQERVRVLQKVREQMPDLAQKIQSEEIAQKIEEIKNADPMQRRELMNSFKKELSQMNEEQRTEAISQMRKEMNQERVQSGEQTKEQTQNMEQKQTQEKVEEQQMRQMQNMQQSEQMNQRQGADQFRQGMDNTQANPNGFGQRH